jgi:hypothetical protein
MKNPSTFGQRRIVRATVISSSDVEVYTPERLAEFFLNNAMDREGYIEVRTEVESMGIDPDSIEHRPLPA